MQIIVNNVILDCWENGSPIWFHIKEGNGDNQISFRYDEAQAIASALQNLVDFTKKAKKK
jgi:hypothetical protein